MRSTPIGNPTPPHDVRAMFDRIARRYDTLNTVMTAGLDTRWRRAAIEAARLRPGLRVLDVACGTGMLARAAAEVVGPAGHVDGIDAAPRMLELARAARRATGAAGISWREADALRLPFDDESMDAVLIGFGLRNLPDYAGALEEMTRVAAPGGRVVVLEIATPRARLPRLVHATWFRRVVPLLGRLAGGGAAYAYLPASLDTYPAPEAIADLMAGAGLTDVRWRWLVGGMTTLHVGVRSR
jgi:demethylmenaquinone methyltransferase / 2-methoxy-6-polyprenyl-1,4-benzoquinol methylase